MYIFRIKYPGLDDEIGTFCRLELKCTQTMKDLQYFTRPDQIHGHFK